MIEFILNNQNISTDAKSGLSLLDFIRKENLLRGTKTGCREGDCGACTVLEGSIENGILKYKSIVSCLTPLINANAKHIVTVEGLTTKGITPVQKSMVDNSATQCGFCTPGFVMSFTGYLLSDGKENAIHSVSGNICRCTGYKSIEKAASDIEGLKKELKSGNEINSMIGNGWLPEYFLTIQQRLLEIKPLKEEKSTNKILIGGGTDLIVQKPEEIRHSHLVSVEGKIPNTIEIKEGELFVGAGINMTDFFNNQLVFSKIPQLRKFPDEIASLQIRNMGTVAGNIVNASPIGDMTIIFLALDASLIVEDSIGKTRRLKLCNFFIDYKKIDLSPGETIKFIVFEKPEEIGGFNFEKVSKRKYLDIASVNSAMSVSTKNNIIEKIHFATGGVAPFPKYMTNTISFLTGKKVDIATLESTLDILQEEISPITDIRGSKEYKRLLARQLFLSHFYKLFPEHFSEEQLLDLMTKNTPTYE